MKKAFLIIVVLAGGLFQIAAAENKPAAGTQTPAENKPAIGTQTAADTTSVIDDTSTTAKAEEQKTGENTVQPQKKESGQVKQPAPTGKPAADPTLDTGSKVSADNKPAVSAGKKDPKTTNKTVKTEKKDVSNEDTTVPEKGKNEYTQNKVDAAVVFNLSDAVESANRSAKNAEMSSQQALSELKQYSRDWEELHNEMSVFIKILAGIVLLCMLLMFAILCMLFDALKKRVCKLEKTFRQQISSVQKTDNQAENVLHRYTNGTDGGLIKDDIAQYGLHEKGTQYRSSQAAVKNSTVGQQSRSAGQTGRTDTVSSANTGHIEQAKNPLPRLYSSESEREKWFSSTSNYSCLKIDDRIRNMLWIGDTVLPSDIVLTQSGNINNALFILLDDKYVYINFGLYNGQKQLSKDIERILNPIYKFYQALPGYVKGCQPALAEKTRDGYKIRQKGIIWLE